MVWLPQHGQSYSAWYDIDEIMVYRHEVESGQFVYPLLHCLKDECLRGFTVRSDSPGLSIRKSHVDFSLADADLTYYVENMFDSIHLERFLDEDRPKLHSCGRVYFEEDAVKLSEDAFDGITQTLRWVVVKGEVFEREVQDTSIDQARVYINIVGEIALKGTVWSAQKGSVRLLDKRCLLTHKFLATQEKLKKVYSYSKKDFRACINCKPSGGALKREPFPHRAF